MLTCIAPNKIAKLGDPKRRKSSLTFLKPPIRLSPIGRDHDDLLLLHLWCTFYATLLSRPEALVWELLVCLFVGGRSLLIVTLGIYKGGPPRDLSLDFAGDACSNLALPSIPWSSDE